MLTELKVYSAWQNAETLLLDDSGREETDLLQIRNIDGLDPVKAAVNTSPFGTVDGEAYVGSSVPRRNIVITVHPNPDWNTWTYEKLRRLVYRYFMPKLATRLVFFSDDMPPVEIYGYVESCDNNPFTKDPEILVSIICPDPYFTAVNASEILGLSGNATIEVEYNGDVETGFNVTMTKTAGAPAPAYIGVQVGDPNQTFFIAQATVSDVSRFEMNSIPGNKYVRNVNTVNGVITNLLNHLNQGSEWPVLKPGTNDFMVNTDNTSHHDFKLTYYERYGGL